MQLVKAITKVDGERLYFEAIKAQIDLKKYKSGVLLWAKEEYPNCMLIISALYGSIFENRISMFRPGMKKVVDEYFTFLDDIKAKNLENYQEEIKISNELVFKKHIQPMNMLVNQDNYIKKFNRELSEGLNMYSSQVQIYTEKTIPILKNSLEQIIEFSFQNRDIEPKNFRFDIEKASTVKDALRQLKSLPNNLQKLRKIIKEANKKIIKIQKESLSSISELDDKFKNLIENLKENIDDNSWVYLRLFQIENIDSFIIHFTKYIARLFHILSHGIKDYPIYIRMNHQFVPRNKLEHILKDEMKMKYPKLSDYLCPLLFYFKDLRNIKAHNFPRVRISDGIAYISRPGIKEDAEMNLKETNRMIDTFSYFIEALGLPKP